MVSPANLPSPYMLFPIVIAIAINSIYPGEVFHHSKYLLIFSSFLTFLLLLMQKSRQGLTSHETFQLLGGGLFLVVVCGPSLAASINKTHSQEVFFLFLGYGLIIIALSWIHLDCRDTLLIFTMFCLVGGIVSFIALHQYLFGLKELRQTLHDTLFLDPEFKSRLLARAQSKRIFANFPLPNTLAGFLVLLIPINSCLVYFSVQPFEGKTRSTPFGLWNLLRQWHIPLPSSLLLIILSLSILALTQSFGGWLCFISSVTTAACLLALSGDLLGRKWVTFIVPGLLLLLVLWIFWISQKRGFGLLAIAAPGNPIVPRSVNFRTALSIFRDFPWTGVGLGNYGVINPRYQSSPLTVTQYAHNTPLQFLAEAGLAALFGFLSLVPFALRKCGLAIQKIRNSKRDHRFFIITLMASSTAWGIHNLIDIDLYFPSLGGLGVLVVGLFLNQLVSRNPENVAKFLPNPVSKMIVAALTVALCLLSCVAARRYLAETTFQMAIESVESNELAQARQEINRSLFFNPNDSASIILQAKILLQEGSRGNKVTLQLLGSAVKLYEKANTLDPYNSENHYELGRLLSAMGEAEEANRARLRAQQLFPSESKYRSPYRTAAKGLSSTKNQSPE